MQRAFPASFLGHPAAEPQVTFMTMECAPIMKVSRSQLGIGYLAPVFIRFQ